MREILFKAKRKDIGHEGEWAEGYIVKPNPVACRAYEIGEAVLGRYEGADFGFVFYSIYPETIRQFTGVYDCTPWEELTTEEQALFLYPLEGGKRSKEDWRGRPIFEGDIIKHYTRYTFQEDTKTADIGVVYWSEIDCSFRRTSQRQDKDYELGPTCRYEIIGNIYDNKVEDFCK